MKLIKSLGRWGIPAFKRFIIRTAMIWVILILPMSVLINQSYNVGLGYISETTLYISLCLSLILPTLYTVTKGGLGHIYKYAVHQNNKRRNKHV